VKSSEWKKLPREERKRIQSEEIEAITEFLTPELNARIRAVLKDYEGDLTVLSSAIGFLVMARFLGWMSVRLMLTGSTYAKYENLLTPSGWPRFKYADHFPERTFNGNRSTAVQMADTVGDFWRVAQGLVPVKNRKSLVDESPKLDVG